MAARFDVEFSLALGADITADPAGWSWTDITEYCMVRMGGVTIRRGRSDWQSQVQPSTCDLLVNNADGRFSRLNPLGAYYGQLTKNTPLRVRARAVGGTYVTRFIGFVSEWPPRWEPSERHFWVPVRADGVLRRIGRSGKPRRSALAVDIQEDTTPIAWWPLEDNAAASSATSGVSDGRSLNLSGTPYQFGAFTDLPGASQSPDMGGDGVMQAAVVGGSAAGWCVEFALRPAGESIPVALKTSAATSYSAWVVILSADALLTFRALGMVTSVSAQLVNNKWHHIACVADQDGADIDLAVYVDGVLIDSDTDAGVTLGAVDGAIIGYSPIGLVQDNPAGLSMSHLAVYNSITPTGAWEAALGFPGEEAHDRFTRLLAAEGAFGSTAAAVSAPMGPQLVGTFLAGLRDCEAADQGVLYEGLDGGLTFQSASERYNLTADLALDYNAGHIKQPFAMADDPQGIINDSTVTRPGGGSARFEQTDGPLGSDPTTGVGRYDETIALNLNADEQALNTASWRVHVGTNDEYRYPTVTLMFHSSSSILTDWLTCDIGSRITVDNMPANPTPDLVDQILEGYTERINSMEWHASLNLSPYTPFAVAEYGETDPDGTGTDRYGAEGCVLFGPHDSTDTSISVVPGERRWSTDADDFDPDLRLRMGGETFDVSSIANAAGFVAVGTADHDVNASVTPGIPTGTTTDDQMYLLAAIRNAGTGTVDNITGWTRITASGSNVGLFRKTAGASESSPTVSFTGGVAGADTSAQIVTFRGMSSGLDEVTAIQANASAQDVAYPGLTVEVDCALVLLCWWKQETMGSADVPAGYTEIAELSTATGDNQSLYWAYQIQSDRASIQAGSTVVTGGGVAISRSLQAGFPGLQTLTVSARSVNGAVKSHTDGTEIRLAKEAVYAL
jgi:hypothetical protein